MNCLKIYIGLSEVLVNDNLISFISQMLMRKRDKRYKLQNNAAQYFTPILQHCIVILALKTVFGFYLINVCSCLAYVDITAVFSLVIVIYLLVRVVCNNQLNCNFKQLFCLYCIVLGRHHTCW